MLHRRPGHHWPAPSPGGTSRQSGPNATCARARGEPEVRVSAESPGCVGCLSWSLFGVCFLKDIKEETFLLGLRALFEGNQGETTPICFGERGVLCFETNTRVMLGLQIAGSTDLSWGVRGTRCSILKPKTPPKTRAEKAQSTLWRLRVSNSQHSPSVAGGGGPTNCNFEKYKPQITQNNRSTQK